MGGARARPSIQSNTKQSPSIRKSEKLGHDGIVPEAGEAVVKGSMTDAQAAMKLQHAFHTMYGSVLPCGKRHLSARVCMNISVGSLAHCVSVCRWAVVRRESILGVKDTLSTHWFLRECGQAATHGDCVSPLSAS